MKIDGNLYAKKIEDTVKKHIEEIIQEGVTPQLAVIIVGDDKASHLYVKKKKEACERVGIIFKKIEFPEIADENDIVNEIEKLNNDDSVYAMLVQLPLPKNMNEPRVLSSIDPKKDVDCLTYSNYGSLLHGDEHIVPCTSLAVIKLIENIAEIAGKHVVIINRSIIGKSLACMMLNRHATVTICHSKTKPLEEYTRKADILISATGRKNLIDADMIKDDSIVIDVGISYTDGDLHGDVDFDSVKEKAKYVTPVPGGVGPVTVSMLLYNMVQLLKQKHLNL
ncbi:bifunctional 5,10-methylenetetrahydrofolate dehydrogenase/5,10-methenyltetrahydrofolate cyclohydrolase [Candidatus Aenigmatarchaeota archaeon]